LGDMGSFSVAFTICGIAVLAAAVVIAMVKQPQKEVLVRQNNKAAQLTAS
jgi:hypothetical protein